MTALPAFRDTFIDVPHPHTVGNHPHTVGNVVTWLFPFHAGGKAHDIGTPQHQQHRPDGSDLQPAAHDLVYPAVAGGSAQHVNLGQAGPIPFTQENLQ